MPPLVYIGVAAGLACAALFASATAGGFGGRLLLFFLAPLPAFLAGLGWGPVAAAISAVTAAIGTTLLISLKAGLLVLVSHGLPAAFLCYLAQLNRPVALPAGSMVGSAGPGASPSPVEWYPVGRLVAASALAAGGLALITLFQLGTDLDQVRKVLRALIDEVFLKQLPGFMDRKIEEPEIKLLTEMALYAFPGAAALSWLGGFLLNLYLAGRITLASGRLPRPWPDLGSMTFPRGFGLLLATALAVVALASGYPALIASAFAGALVLAYVLLGLAIIHDVTRGSATRPFILWGVYGAIVVLNPWSGLILALIGVLEPILPWRRSRRIGAPPPSTPST